MQDFNNRGNELTPEQRNDVELWERELQVPDDGLVGRIGIAATILVGAACVNTVNALDELRIHVSHSEAVRRTAAAVSVGIASMSAVFSPGTYRAYRNSRDNQ